MKSLEFRNKTKELLFELTEFCEKNDIWYSLAEETLLGAARHSGFIPWQIKADIMMTVSSYEKLRNKLNLIKYNNKNKRNDNIVSQPNIKNINEDQKKLGKLYDSFQHRWYYQDGPTYQKNESSISGYEPHVKILLLIPTTKEKQKKYFGFFNTLLRYFRKTNYIDVVKKYIQEENYEGWMLLVGNRRNKNIVRNFYPNIDFETTKLLWNGRKLNVIRNYRDFLSWIYGEDYMQVFNIPNKYKEFPNGVKYNVIRYK